MPSLAPSESCQVRAARLRPGPRLSSQRRLVEAMGHVQPWAALPLDRLQELMGRARVLAIVVDPPAAQGAWRWRESDLERLKRDLT